MGILEEYLKEREEYFFHEESEEPEDSLEEPIEDYGLDFVDDETFTTNEIDVDEVPDNSDPILDADEFLKPNAETLEIYAKGKGFDLTDNQDLYEVVKLVKDMTDKHLYMKDMTWKVDIKNRKAIFTFRLGEDEELDQNDFFLQGVEKYIISEMWRKYGPLYDVNAEFLKDAKGRDVMKLAVEKDDNEERKRSENIIANAPDSASFLTKSSVSRM